MAHPNATQRQAYVKSLLDQGQTLRAPDHRNIAQMFGCSTAAIVADITYLCRNPSVPAFTGANMRARIYARDGRKCQYCGNTYARNYVIEHVVPAAMNGPARPHNLVVACASCNSIKGRAVWEPFNVDTITEKHAEWREKIKALATQVAIEFDLAPECAAWAEQQVTTGRFRSVGEYIENLINRDQIDRERP